MSKMNKNRDILEYFTQRNFNFKPKKQTLTKPHKNGGMYVCSIGGWNNFQKAVLRSLIGFQWPLRYVPRQRPCQRRLWPSIVWIFQSALSKPCSPNGWPFSERTFCGFGTPQVSQILSKTCKRKEKSSFRSHNENWLCF